MTRSPLTRARLAHVAGGPLSAVQRLRGGSKKGVYRLHLAGGGTRVAYVWSAAEDFWPEPPPDPPFGHATGLGLFLDAHRALTAIGVRVPELHAVHRDDPATGGDVAVLEDVRGGTLEALGERDPARAAPVLTRLSATLRTMHGHRRAAYGRPGEAHDADVPALIRDRALRHLAAAAARVPRLAAVEADLAGAVRDRWAAVRPRTRYGLIHGELGGDHVLVGPGGEPVLIDIEGVMFFDVEWEHVFLELRFNERYPALAAPGLDAARLRLYRLAMYLSLVEGPLRLLDGDFPDRAGMRAIAEDNIRRAVAELD